MKKLFVLLSFFGLVNIPSYGVEALVVDEIVKHWQE